MLKNEYGSVPYRTVRYRLRSRLEVLQQDPGPRRAAHRDFPLPDTIQNLFTSRIHQAQTERNMAEVPATLTNLKDMIQFYLSYHKDRTNRLAHIVSLPFLTTSFLIFLCYVRLPPLPDLAFVVTVCYTAYLIYLDPMVGFVFAPYAGVLYFLALLIVSVVPATIVVPLAVLVHLVCWAAQVFGHVGCESNRPAMFTSLVHSVLAAPVVVYLETLFSFGLLSETQERLDDARGLTLENATTTVTATTITTEPVTTIYGTAQA